MKALRPFLRLWRRHCWRLLCGLVLMIITLLASIGLLTLSGWFLAASSLAGTAGLYSFNYLLPAAGVRGAAIIRTVARYGERLVSHDATFRLLAHLRVFIFSKLLPLTPASLQTFRHGELLNRFVADVDTLDHLYLRVISPLAGALLVVFIVTLGLSWLDLSLALTLGALMLLTLLLLPPLFYRAGLPGGAALTQLRSQYRLQLTQWLQGQAELAVYGQSKRMRHLLASTERLWQQQQCRQSSLTGFSQAATIIISGVTVTLLLWLAAGGVGKQHEPGALTALFVFCALATFEVFAPVNNAFQHLGHVMASAQRISQLLRQKPAVQFPDASPPVTKATGMMLKNVSFSYPGAVQPALHQLSLHIRPGERVAILGPTGCGKTTLLQLLTRAWDPQQGEVSLHDITLPRWDEASLRARFSVVSQRVHIFSQTLRDNLLLAAPESGDDALCRVLQEVGLEKLLSGAEGLDSWLGEGGRPLSGGEQRRLAIARALLHNGEVFLFDEPTESLDAETEQQILHLLDQVTMNKTSIMITHRLHGLERMDTLYVMDQGEIIEQGNHQTLMAKRGRYWQFHQCC